MVTKRPLVVPPLGTKQGGLQAPTLKALGGVTGQKMQPITRGVGSKGSGGDKSNNGGSK